MYRLFLKPIFFLFSPERAHHLAMKLFKIALNMPILNILFKKIYKTDNPLLEKKVLGLTFKNPVGLAAGFDKDGQYLDILPSLGFGFVELGTVTPLPQDGNPQPRLFRLPDDEALINRMGFNNKGVDNLVNNLKNYRNVSASRTIPTLGTEGVIIGGNIGKNKVTPNENATNDYEICFNALFDYVDYFVVNVSSPNTPNLRELQDKEPLTKLLSRLQVLNKKKTVPKPILLKIAPDLTDSQLDDILEIVKNTELSGLVATNTTISRDKLETPPLSIEAIGAGGLSGKPLKNRSTDVIRYLRKGGEKNMVIIGVGGIVTAEDALEKIEAGADLIQIYTGMVYEGPELIKKINTALLEKR
jgi:dihydroorotate dehydrogenase